MARMKTCLLGTLALTVLAAGIIAAVHMAGTRTRAVTSEVSCRETTLPDSSGKNPWASHHFLLTQKHLLEVRADGQISAKRRTENEKTFVSSDGSMLCRAVRGEGGRTSFSLFGKESSPLWRTDLLVNCGDVFIAKDGASVVLNGYGTIDEFHAHGVAFLDSKGSKLSEVRPEGGITSLSSSRDGRALLLCGPTSRKEPNHANRLSLYALGGARQWEASIGRLRQAGESVVSSNAVFVTTYAPGVRLLRFSREDGRQVFSKAIENGSPKAFYFYRYLVLSDDDTTIVGTGGGNTVAIDASTGRTIWHSDLQDVPESVLPREPNGARSYAVACSRDGSHVAVLAATIGGINNSDPTVCRHYVLFYNLAGELKAVRSLETTTDVWGVRKWHRYIIPKFGAGQLYILDGISEALIVVDVEKPQKPAKISLLKTSKDGKGTEDNEPLQPMR